jgi:hypothetical protein
MGDAAIAYSAQNYHRGFPGPFYHRGFPRPLNGNPEAENDLAALRVHRAVFRELKIIQSEIAGKVRDSKIAGGGKLIKAHGILPIMVRRVFLNSREQGGHGVNGMCLS